MESSEKYRSAVFEVPVIFSGGEISMGSENKENSSKTNVRVVCGHPEPIPLGV